MNPLAPLWIERFEKMGGVTGLPRVSDIRRSVEEYAARIASGAETWPPERAGEQREVVGDWTETIEPGRLNVLNPSEFRLVPAVFDRLRASRVLAGMVGLDMDQAEQNEWNILFNWYNFRTQGRRVYVLDSALYELLLGTDLPDWFACELNFPLPHFYVKLPDAAFNFAVPGDPDPQPVEGVFVTVTKTRGDETESRELTLMFTGRSRRGIPGDDNIAYGSISVGPHAKLRQIRFSGFAQIAPAEHEHLANEVPHVVLSLVLYLQSAHPDLVPVDPPVRRRFGYIRSPREREAAERHQEAFLASVSRLSYIRLGAGITPRARRESDFLAEHRHLEIGHEVRGFWRAQPYGPGRSLRKTIWVEPYWRGPDYAETIAIRAQKLPRGREK